MSDPSPAPLPEILSGYRPNAAMVVVDGRGRALLAERVDGKGWQFPQGGIDAREDAVEGMLRELREEVGLDREAVRIVESSAGWLHYRVPERLRAEHPRLHRKFHGQAQKWFLLEMRVGDERVRLDAHPDPEFSNWRWAPYWRGIDEVIDFKKEVYRQGLWLLRLAHARLCRGRACDA